MLNPQNNYPCVWLICWLSTKWVPYVWKPLKELPAATHLDLSYIRLKYTSICTKRYKGTPRGSTYFAMDLKIYYKGMCNNNCTGIYLWRKPSFTLDNYDNKLTIAYCTSPPIIPILSPQHKRLNSIEHFVIKKTTQVSNLQSSKTHFVIKQHKFQIYKIPKLIYSLLLCVLYSGIMHDAHNLYSGIMDDAHNLLMNISKHCWCT